MKSSSGVFTYGLPNGGGCRASEFSIGDLKVQVTGTTEDHTESAFELACELSRSGIALAAKNEEIAAKDEEIGSLRVKLADAKAKLPGARAAQLLGPGFVRFTPSEMWLLGKRESGWAAFGVRCASWDDLFRRYNVRVTGHGTDEHGEWWSVENRAEVNPAE